MDSEMIAWFQVNWVFGLVLFSIIYLLCNRKESHEPIKTFAFLFFFIWGVWRLVSNYILNQWGNQSEEFITPQQVAEVSKSTLN